MADEGKAKESRLPALRLPSDLKGLKPAEVREILRSVVLDPLYLQNLFDRARRGKLPPPVETFLLSHVFGKPVDQVEIKRAEVIKIIHEVPEEGTRRVIDITPEKESDGANSHDAVGDSRREVPEEHE